MLMAVLRRMGRPGRSILSSTTPSCSSTLFQTSETGGVELSAFQWQFGTTDGKQSPGGTCVGTACSGGGSGQGIPEPGSLLLSGTGLIGAYFLRRLIYAS